MQPRKNANGRKIGEANIDNASAPEFWLANLLWWDQLLNAPPKLPTSQRWEVELVVWSGVLAFFQISPPTSVISFLTLFVLPREGVQRGTQNQFRKRR